MEQSRSQRRSRRNLWHVLTLLILPAVLGLSTLAIRSGVAAAPPQGPRKLAEIGASRALISPDSRYVVYTVGPAALYRVSPGGADPVMLASEASRWFEISADSRYVVYSVERESRPTELYSVPLAGGAPVPLLTVSTPGQYIEHFTLSPDGRRVVAAVGRSEQFNVATHTLISAPLDGSAPAVQLTTHDDTEDSIPLNFSITPDSQSLLYTRAVMPKVGIWSVPLAGGTPTQLSEGGMAALTPDGQSIIFLRPEQDRAQLYIMPVSGGSMTRLEGQLRGEKFPGYAVSADSQWIVVGHSPDGDRCGLLSQPLSGTQPPIQLIPADICVDDYQISQTSAGAYVIYTAEPSPEEAAALVTTSVSRAGPALYSVPLAGGPIVRLTLPTDEGIQPVQAFSLSPDQQSVIYTTATDASIWSVPVAGGTAPTRLGRHTQLSDEALIFTPDGRAVLYVAEDETDSGQRGRSLFLAPLDGRTAPHRVSGDLAHVQGFEQRGDVFTILLNGMPEAVLVSNDGSFAVLQGVGREQQPGVQTAKALYSVPLAQPWYRTLWN